MTIVIGTLAVIAGALPPRALGLVAEWAAQHEGELHIAWQKAKVLEIPGAHRSPALVLRVRSSFLLRLAGDAMHAGDLSPGDAPTAPHGAVASGLHALVTVANYSWANAVRSLFAATTRSR
ncbi:MAG: DUF4160 domain-containing protein [Thermaerobacter sp.]|nr:DUF4160 domain-containing protein [Thermaerobacter sp.]